MSDCRRCGVDMDMEEVERDRDDIVRSRGFEPIIEPGVSGVPGVFGRSS